MIDRTRLLPVLVTGGAAIALLGTFLPWVRSGTVDRSSYEILDIVDRLGFSPDGAVGWALRAWPLVPLLMVLSVVTLWWPVSNRVFGAFRRTLPIAASLYAGGTAFAVMLAPDIGLFRIGAGPPITVIGSAVMAGGALWSLSGGRTSISATGLARRGPP